MNNYNNNNLVYFKLKTMKDNGLKEYKKIESKYYRKNGKIYRSNEYY